MYYFAAITCPSLVEPINAIITYTTDITAPFDYQTTATYSCTSGFGLSRGDMSRTCIFSSTSSSGGAWNGSAPTCEGM